ncbi:PepSY domain-containing protein [Halobacillus massiliensis]|uniref:PepSY domain-containing protein n=1 Tax=Halobacillus massiliensis TaxID=1926286 RepID=UPI0009E50D2A|nr:PepSY domain-containing protein [Halobacillus massiliensis]
MFQTRAKKILGSAAALILLIILIWQIVQSTTSAEPMTEREAADYVASQYGGSILEAAQKDDLFVVSLQTDKGEYKVQINRYTSEIEHMERFENNSRDPLTQKEAEAIALENQPGSLSSTKKRKDENTIVYEVQIENKDEMVTLLINEEGTILDKQVKQEQEEERTTLISEKEAIEKALQEVKGKVDDVDYETSGNLPYYLIEIERDDDDAEVQIHAITGEILSIKWDD